MACEAAFMGGPANGRTQAFPGDEPPAEYAFDQFLGFDHDPPSEKITYIRQVSQMDQGPLWVFVPKTT
jgi:hypothetical protein